VSANGKNSARHLPSPALRGAQEISFTILSMTISLAAVFLPLVLMSG